MDYRQPVRFGVFVTPVATEDPMRQAIAADELGFDIVGIQDHPYQRRFFDTWTILTAIAMRTERITLFPDVANLPLRPPAMLAKAAATLDILSDGRLELGLGAGGFWKGIEAYDGPVRTPGESVSAVEEAIQVMRLLWSGQHGIRFEGKFYRLAGAHSGPMPKHPIGIWLGAYRPRMLSIIGRLADGWVPSYGYLKEGTHPSASRPMIDSILGRLADGWVPSYGYLKEPELLEGNKRIDEAATAVGRCAC